MYFNMFRKQSSSGFYKVKILRHQNTNKINILIIQNLYSRLRNFLNIYLYFIFLYLTWFLIKLFHLH